MAITCSWEYPIGTCYRKYDEKKEHPLTIWGGGNCLAIMTSGKNKNLEYFFIDKQHFKNHDFIGDEFTDIVLYTQRKETCKKLMNLFFESGFSFKLEYKGFVKGVN